MQRVGISSLVWDFLHGLDNLELDFFPSSSPSKECYDTFGGMFGRKKRKESEVTKSRLILCDPVDCSTQGSSVLKYLQEFAQIHVH